MVKVRVLKWIPRFVGDDLREYGPYNPGDIADLTPVMAQILVLRRMAEYVEEEK